MSIRRVIDDSEDEHAGFSPVNSPLNSPLNSPVKDRTDPSTAASASDGGQGVEPQLADSALDQRSTDPEFFHKVYEELQHVHVSARVNTAVEGISDKQKSSDSIAKNSSSITDPTLKTFNKNKKRDKENTAIDSKHFANLTQITTPRNHGSSGPRMDVYDFPSSDGEGGGAWPLKKAMATKTYGKRKRVHTATSEAATRSSSSIHPSAGNQGLSLVPVHDDQETLPGLNKAKGTQKTLGSPDEDVDLLVLPRTACTSQSFSQPQDGNKGPGTVVRDTNREPQDPGNRTPASFYIAPLNQLTGSQKQEYLCMTGSSEDDDHAGRENHLPLHQPGSQAQRPHSSEATIAYPTPSRYCSTAPGFPEIPGEDGRDSSAPTTSVNGRAHKSTVDQTDLPSSPDQLNPHSVDHLGPSRKQSRDSDEADDLAKDDSWDHDKIGYAREQYEPRPSRKRSRIDQDKQPSQADTGTATAKRKRQKTGKGNDAVQDDGWDCDNIGAHRESYRPRPSRRRSRVVLDAGDDDLAGPEQSMPDTSPPGPASPGGMEKADPILMSSGQQAPQGPGDIIEGIDPSYLGALPEDLRQEVIADQLARNSQAARTRGRGRGRPSQGGDTPQPKERGRKKATAHQDVPTLADDGDSRGAAAPTPAANKKKRGRPKKTAISPPPPAPTAGDGMSLAHEVQDAPDAAHEVAAAPPGAPSKRGRKKKVAGETAAAAEEEAGAGGAEDAGDGKDQEAAREVTAPSKKGGKRKVVEEAAPGCGAEGQAEREALADVTSNAASSLGHVRGTDGWGTATPEAVGDGTTEATPETKAEEAALRSAPGGTTTTTHQQGRVPLRVGLSRRWRIAPLLKMIRK